MRTKITFVLMLLMLAWTTPLFSQEKILESKWAAQPARIDGQGDEWSEDVLFFEKSAKVKCAFRNDEENLYVVLVFEDRKSLSSINATGITLSFNTEGKKKKTTGFHFIKKMLTPEEVIADLEKQGEVLSEEQRLRIRAKAGAIVYAAEMLKSKGQHPSGEIVVTSSLRAAFKTAETSDRVIYEFRVPLAKSETHALGIGAAPGQTVNINLEWGGMTEEMRKAMQARTRGELGRGISGESGAGTVIVPETESGGAPGGASMAVPKKYSFWVGVKLSQRE